MKRIKEYIFLLILFLIPINVFAESKAIIKAPTQASPDQEISIDIVASNDVSIDNFKATLTYETSVLEILSIENQNNWVDNTEFKDSSPLTLDFSHENGLKGKTTIATIKFRVKKDVSKSSTIISLEASTRTTSDQTINTLDKVSQTIAIKSTDNTLKEIKLNGETLTNFSPKQFEYSLVVEQSVTTASIESTLNDKTAKFKNNTGPKKSYPLEYGDNKIKIVVIAANGEEKTYTLNIKREDNRGTNNDLKNIIINSNPKLLEEFDKDSLLYTVTTHKLETIDIAAEPVNPNATVVIKKPEKLITGSNEVIITVTSEKKEEKVYKILINNLDTEIDTTLKNIEMFNYSESLNFKKDKFDYEITYKASDIDSLVIKPIVNNPDEAVYTMDKEVSKLKAGDTLTITVSARDGTKNVESYYTITFKKDNRINFFLILSLTIFIVLLVIFIKLFIENKKEKKKIEEKEKEKEIEKTKRLEKINLE